ncbi:MAG: hypothetical protein AAF170_05790 [Bacteroidota bacterium]
MSDLRPDDFALRYQWRAGSMPPPHHYSVRVEIEADGSGTVQMTPDYSGADVPTWTLPFHLDAEAIDDLYTTLGLEGLFSIDWQEPPGPPRVGGSLWSVTATAGGQQATVKNLMVSPEGERPKAIREVIWEAVPKGLRAELVIRRNAYRATYRLRR